MTLEFENQIKDVYFFGHSWSIEMKAVNKATGSNSLIGNVPDVLHRPLILSVNSSVFVKASYGAL